MHRLSIRRCQCSAWRMNGEDHPLVALPSLAEFQDIIVQHDLTSRALYLHERNLVSGDILCLDVDPFRNAAEPRQPDPSSPRQDKVDEQFEIAVPKSGDQLS